MTPRPGEKSVPDPTTRPNRTANVEIRLVADPNVLAVHLDDSLADALDPRQRLRRVEVALLGAVANDFLRQSRTHAGKLSSERCRVGGVDVHGPGEHGERAERRERSQSERNPRSFHCHPPFDERVAMLRTPPWRRSSAILRIEGDS